MIALNSGIVWPKGFWVKRPGKITLIISKPIPEAEVINSPVRELNEKTEEWINNTKNELASNTSFRIAK